MLPSSSRGTRSNRSTYRAGTASSQTVCQMPDWAVYQMPPRTSRCLPLLGPQLLERSRTRTTSSCGLVVELVETTSVRSIVNGRYPPWW